MTDKRDHWTYRFKLGNKTLHAGITMDPERREKEHQRRWGDKGRLVIEGRAKTEEGARKWEETKQKTITPQRKPR
jgi:predicted GIY-YIG superfamily endonuclease